MSGKILNLLERRRFEFSYLTGSTSQGVTIAPMIDVCGYGYVALYARVHARSMASGQSLNFNVYNILPSDEDAREFVETDSTGAPISLFTVSITSAQPAIVPGMYSNASTSGPYVKLVLTATQASSPATFYAEVSLLLHMRESR